MTFSLLGRCTRTGMLGAVVTTSSIAVGSRCPFARAGVGAALTQHRTDPRLGPLALDLVENGFTAQQAMDAIVAATPHRDWRQLAIIDGEGRTASFGGERVKPEKSEAHGLNCVAARQHRSLARGAGSNGARFRGRYLGALGIAAHCVA